MRKIVIATNNSKKKSELIALLSKIDVQILTLNDVGFIETIDEPYYTLHENAMHKAKTVFEKTGIPCIADDSGLFVDALNGSPGVFSARYAGDNSNDQENMDKLLADLEKFGNRNASFKRDSG